MNKCPRCNSKSCTICIECDEPMCGFCDCEEDIETQCPTIITASQCSPDNYPHIGYVTTCYGCDGDLLATANGWEHMNPRQENGAN